MQFMHESYQMAVLCVIQQGKGQHGYQC